MEGIIVSSPFIDGVMMFGRGRNQVGVLVEPHAELVVDIRDDNAIAEFRNKIWYVSRLLMYATMIEHADRDTKGHSLTRQTRPHQHSAGSSRR